MSKFSQGIYTIKNPEKYVGGSPPVFRSSWERRVFMWLDNNPNVVRWASEAVKIPYRNPLTQAMSNYIPDLLIEYNDKTGTRHVELVEIKPLRETVLERAKTRKDKMALAVNMAKWQFAQQWCKQQGIKFRVITERDLFVQKR